MTEIIEPSVTRLLPPSEALALLNSDINEDANSLQSMSQQAIDAKEKTVSFFGVSFTSFGLLFDDELNKELVDFVDVCAVPNGPSWLQGFTNIRGAITPVLDLNRVFGLDQASPDKTNYSKDYLLAIGKGFSSFALPLTTFPEKLTFSLSSTHNDQDLAPDVLRPFIKFCFRKSIPWFAIAQHDFLQHLKNRP